MTAVFNKPISLWAIAVVITISIAVFQRITGPTYPISGKTELNNNELKFKFLRSHSTSSDCEVKVQTTSKDYKGILFWKRYKTNDDWTSFDMVYIQNELVGKLPKQKAAGKLIYYVNIFAGDNLIQLPEEEQVIIRFKGDVPLVVLIIHVFAMFGAMLLSTRTGLEFFNKEPKLKKLTIWTLTFLFIGGLILGPVVQKYAFDAYWTGFPFGHDLTDNKTAFAFLGWLTALFMYRKSLHPKRWALTAAILLLVVYLIPHSVLGSELDYEKIDKNESNLNSQIQDK